MGRHSKDWNEGYQAAIEQLRKIAKGEDNTGGQSSGNGNQQDGGQSGLDVPKEAYDKAKQEGGQSGQSNQQGNQQGQSGQGQSGQGGGSSNSRTNPNDSSQGIVRAEDCASRNAGVEGTPNTPGGFFSKEEGDKLAKQEGYEKEGGSDSAVEQDWKDASLRAANQIPERGDAWSKLKATIEGLYKVQTDWKKILKYIVGKSINSADKRQAYANKNILVSQDRIARTDKDKYDTIDYMIVFIDTSGSMTNSQIKQILCEVYEMALKKKPLKIYVMYCDTKIQHIDEYKSIKDLKKDAISTTRHGYGGTAVQPLWDILKTDKRFKRKKPDLIMIFTDGGIEHASGNTITINRDKKTMNWLVWCIMDNPGCNLAQNDSLTKIIHLKTQDIK